MASANAARWSYAFSLHLPLAPIITRSRLFLPRAQPYKTWCSTITSTASAQAAEKRIVFLGTPQVAANTLKTLHEASTAESSTFSIAGVVTQPPAPVGRKRQLTKSPVHQLAETLALNPIFTPGKARDKDFLSGLAALEPDLCVTAAYGNFLPQEFLVIPKFGTLNIHPSLLPCFRGAAPVPRALEAGVSETGVCVAYTVLKMDAGPIVARHVRPLNGDEQGSDLLEELFAKGTQALLDVLPEVWADTASFEPQNDCYATHARKLSKDESRLTFTENARVVHNKVRAFAGWPGTWGDFILTDENGSEEIRLKILHTIIIRDEGGMCLGIHDVVFNEEHDCLAITCGDGSVIGARSVQLSGKKLTSARSFWNGLRGRSLQRKRLPYS